MTMTARESGSAVRGRPARLLALLLAGALAACCSPTPRRRRPIDLERCRGGCSGRTGHGASAVGARDLTVARPRAAAALDSERIAVVARAIVSTTTPVCAGPSLPRRCCSRTWSARWRLRAIRGGVFAAPARVPRSSLLDVELRRFEVAAGADAAARGRAGRPRAAAGEPRRCAARARVASFSSEAAVAAAENRLPRSSRRSIAPVRRSCDDVVARVQAAAASVASLGPSSNGVACQRAGRRARCSSSAWSPITRHCGGSAAASMPCAPWPPIQTGHLGPEHLADRPRAAPAGRASAFVQDHADGDDGRADCVRIARDLLRPAGRRRGNAP